MTDKHDNAHSHTGATHLDTRLITDPFERRFYTQDMALVPDFLVQPFLRTIPDALARPRSTQEAAEAIHRAMAQGLAIVPRAAATTALFNAVPLHGGWRSTLPG